MIGVSWIIERPMSPRNISQTQKTYCCTSGLSVPSLRLEVPPSCSWVNSASPSAADQSQVCRVARNQAHEGEDDDGDQQQRRYERAAASFTTYRFIAFLRLNDKIYSY